MKVLLFDSGPIISFTTNNLLWLLPELKQRFGGDFYIAKAVQKELVDRPMKTKKWKFEAFQVQHMIDTGVLRVIDSAKVTQKAKELMQVANSCFEAHHNPIRILQQGEMEVIAASMLMNMPNIAVDERVTRMLIEDPDHLKNLLERRLHTKIFVNKERLHKVAEETRHCKLIRSIELATVAYELGLLDKYLIEIPKARQQLLESVLWGLKLNGASISEREIREILQLESKR